MEAVAKPQLAQARRGDESGQAGHAFEALVETEQKGRQVCGRAEIMLEGEAERLAGTVPRTPDRRPEREQS